MDIELDFFNEKFNIKHAVRAKLKPFSHIDVVVNCDQPLSRTNGPLERDVEAFLSKTFAPLGLKTKWSHSPGWVQKQRVGNHEFPRISRFGMGIDLEI